MSEYTRHAWREGEWWVIDIDGIGTTRARTLDTIDHMARSLVAYLADLLAAHGQTAWPGFPAGRPTLQVKGIQRRSRKTWAAAGALWAAPRRPGAHAGRRGLVGCGR